MRGELGPQGIDGPIGPRGKLITITTCEAIFNFIVQGKPGPNGNDGIKGDRGDGGPKGSKGHRGLVGLQVSYRLIGIEDRRKFSIKQPTT